MNIRKSAKLATSEIYDEIIDVRENPTVRRINHFLWHDPVGRIVPLIADESFDSAKRILEYVAGLALHEYFTYEIDTYTDAKSLNKLNYFITTFVIMVMFVVFSRVVQDMIHRNMGPSGMTPLEEGNKNN